MALCTAEGATRVGVENRPQSIFYHPTIRFLIVLTFSPVSLNSFWIIRKLGWVFESMIIVNSFFRREFQVRGNIVIAKSRGARSSVSFPCWPHDLHTPILLCPALRLGNSQRGNSFKTGYRYLPAF